MQRNPRIGSYLVGSTKEGWMLTENGLKFVYARRDDIEGENLTRTRYSNKEKQWLSNERSRLLASDAFLKFQTDGIDAVSLHEAEAFFRIDDYVAHEHVNVKLIA